MRKRLSARFGGICAAISAIVLAIPSASKAEDLYWDTNGTTIGFGGFGGNWNGVTTNWNSDPTGNAAGPLAATTTSADALIVAGAGATGIINLSTTAYAASLDLANAANLAAFQISNSGSLALTGALTDTGAGAADVRIHNTTEASAATKLTASSVTTGVVDVSSASGGVGQFFTTGYDVTLFTQYSIGSGSGTGGNTTIRQTAGTVTVNNAADRGFVLLATSDFTSSSSYTNRYILDGGTMKANRIGIANNDGNNNATNKWARDARLEFNNGTLQSFNNGSLLLQNNLTFNTYNGSGTKDMGYNTSKPITVELSQTGSHTFNADGASSTILVTPSAQLVNKTGENGTVTKTGLGTLVFTGGNPLAVNSYTGSTTVSAGTVSTDYKRIAGSAATGGMDNLSNAYSAGSQLILNGGNYSLVGRGSAAAGSSTGVLLNAGAAGMQLNVGSTTGLVVGQSVTNANLPAGTYIRRIINGTTIELNATSTSTTNLTGETLDFGAATFANTQTINSVDLQQAGNTTTVTVTPGAGSSTTLLSFGEVSGSGGFTKAGTGTLKLTGTLTYTGDTAVHAGTLVIDGNGSAATGTISVALGATLDLGPSAVLGGPVISSGRILPGTYHNNLTLGTTSRVPFKVNGIADYETVANDGGDILTFEDHTTLELDFTAYTPIVGDAFTLFPNWSARTGNSSAVLVMTTGLGPIYALDTTNLLVNGSVSLRSVAGSPIAKQTDSTLIRVSNGERFYPVGFNYIRLNLTDGGQHSTFHVSDYDGPAASAMFQRLARAGYTAVRVFINTRTESESGAGWQTSLNMPLNPTYLDHFADFLKRAAAEGILVQPSMPSFPWNAKYASIVGTGPPMVTGANSYYLHPGFITAREAYLIDFWNGIRARYPDCAEALLCVDLENELNYSVTEQPFSLASGTFDAANGQSYDLATQKQNLADDMAVYWVNRISRTIRNLLPTTLINANVFSYDAVGRSGPGDFRVFGAGWKDRVPFRPRALAASDADIVDLHFYWESLADSPTDLDSIEFETFKSEALAAGKVLTIGEFGSLYAHIPANEPASALAALPTMADHFIDQGFQGWLLWTYDSIEQANHHLATDANFAIFNHLAQEIPGATGPELADNFGGSTFSQEWTQTTPASWSVSGGAATLITSFGLQQIYQNHTFTDFRANTRFQFTGNESGRGGIAFRKQQPDNAVGTTGYTAFMTAAGQVTLDVYDSSTAALITLGTIQTSIDPFAEFVDLTVEAVGTRIKVWANGTLFIDVNDSRRSMGSTSFFLAEIAGKIDLVAVNNISQPPDGDADGDGHTQSEEFIWGTNDSDPSSFFRPEVIFTPGSGFILAWDGLAERRYTIWRSQTMSEGSWFPVFDTGVLNANLPVQYADPSSLSQPKSFYRIEGAYYGP